MPVDQEVERRIREQLKCSVGEELARTITLNDAGGYVEGYITMCTPFPLPQTGVGIAFPNDNRVRTDSEKLVRSVMLAFEQMKSMCEDQIDELERIRVDSKEVVKDAS